jgi:hypothetical protein
MIVSPIVDHGRTSMSTLLQCIETCASNRP